MTNTGRVSPCHPSCISAPNCATMRSVTSLTISFGKNRENRSSGIGLPACVRRSFEATGYNERHMPAGRLRFDRLRLRLDRWRERIEQFIAGRPPSDPLYLSNRTWKQKLKLFAIAGAPVLVLIAMVAMAATDVFRWHKVDPY